MKYIPRFHSLKFQIKFLAFFIIVVMTIALGYSCFSLIWYNDSKYNQWCNEKISSFENSLNQKYYNLKSIMTAFTYDKNVQRLLSGDIDSPYEIVTPIGTLETNLIQLMCDYSLLDPDIMDVYVCDQTGKVTSYITYQFQDQQLFQRLLEKSAKTDDVCVSEIFYMNHTPSIAMAAPIKMKITNNDAYGNLETIRIGTTIFTIRATALTELSTQIENHKVSMYLMDQKGNILQQVNDKELPTTVDKKIHHLKNVAASEMIANEVDGYAINAKTVDLFQWNMVLVSPISTKHYFETHQYFSIVIVWLIALMIILTMSISLLTHVNNFIHKIVEHMSLVAKGDLSLRLGEMKKTEFNQVAEGFNSMIQDLDQLTHQNLELSTQLYREEVEKVNATLLALQNQMNPHFLHNTIECIKNIGICYDVKEIEQLSTALSRVLRYSLKEEHVVTVYEELDCIKQYVMIQSIRFENKYQVEYQIDDTLIHLRILRLSLEPLVENAMKHGLEKKTDVCRLIISITQDEEFFYLSIEDNGIGMSQEQVSAILSGDNGKKGSVGLRNLINRLKLFYHDGAELQIQSREHYGTVMKICIRKDSQLN
ncbi:MAG: sensor histidine kinase [Massiliimalia sp.]|jgi:two-component system sensor histidine kinase YesM